MVQQWAEDRESVEHGLSFHRPFREIAKKKVILLLANVSRQGAVAELVGIEVGVVSGVMNLESSGVEAPEWRPRHDEAYHQA